MRTKSQIKSILYNSLSDPRWISLRDAHLGSEFISIAAEIVYNYELSFDKYHRDTQSVEEIKSDLNVGIASGPVKDALLTWLATTIYEVRETINKGHLDKNWITCTNYASLISHAAYYDFPVIRKAAAYLMVQLPAGNKSFKPYEIAISAGSATFYNITPCRSGEQVVLYQGVPYTFIHGEDSSTYPSAQEYTTALRFVQISGDTQYECYASLPADTYPESVEFFIGGNSKKRYRFRDFESIASGVAPGDFVVTTAPDDTKRVYFSKKVTVPVNDAETQFKSDVLGRNFSIDAKSWCVRFLSLTFIEFDESSIQLPDGYVFLMAGNSIDTIEYQKNYFARQLFANYLKTDLTEILRMTCDSFPGVLDSSISGYAGGSMEVYIKPSHENTNVLFTDLEHYLNDNHYGNSSYTTMTADNIEFSFILTPNGINDSQMGKVEDYLRSHYSYSSLKFKQDVSAAQVECEIATMFGVSENDPSYPPVYVDIRISHIVSNMAWIDSSNYNYTRKTLTFTKEGVQKGWSDDSALYYVNETVSNYLDVPSHPVLASNACQAKKYVDLDPSTQGTDAYIVYDGRVSSGYEDDSADPDISTLYRNRWYLGSNCAVAFNSDFSKIYVASLEDAYFSNPCNLHGPAYIDYDVSSALRTDLQSVADSSPCGGSSFSQDGTTLFAIIPFSNRALANPTLIIYTLVSSASSRYISRYSTTSLKVPAIATSISAYNGLLYISCDDASVTVFNYDSSLSYKSYRLQDSFGNILPSTDVPWKFTSTDVQSGTEGWNICNFFLQIDSKGKILIVSLDTTPPDLSCPPNYNETTWGTSVTPFKQQVKSKWNVYIADSLKITLKGIELINLRQLNQIPTLDSSNPGIPLIQTVVAPGGICSPSVVYSRHTIQLYSVTEGGVTETYSRLRVHSFYSYDYTTELTSVTEPNIVVPASSGPLPDTYFRNSNHSTSQVGTYDTGNNYGSVSLTDGRPVLSTFTAIAAGASPQVSRYIKLSNQDIVWDL